VTNNLYYVLVFGGTVIFCAGVVCLLRKPFYGLATSAVKQLDIILDDSINEVEKDRRILRNLWVLLKLLFITIFVLGVLTMCAALPAYIYTSYPTNRKADLSSFYFYLSMFLGSFSLLLFRKKGDYSYWSKLLHTLILDNYNLGKFLFERATRHLKKDEYLAEKPFVIVTGLARSGTTALTNLLFDEAVFHSISYANVPFLLAPNLWKKIYAPTTSKKKERAHGDQVLFSENSIEAFEEYFFKVFLNDSYIKEDCLLKHEIPEDVLVKYRMYQTLFKQNNTTIYLAKNNNFLLRYESMLKSDKMLKPIFIFRNPLDHAASLLRQHENFLIRQKEDNFVLEYMNWLGHHEFGLNQKYFLFDNQFKKPKSNTSELSYWLAIWSDYYSYISEISNTHKIYLVHYEDLLKKPDELKRVLTFNLGIKLGNRSPEPFTPNPQVRKNMGEPDNNLLKKANAIYTNLMSKKITLSD